MATQASKPKAKAKKAPARKAAAKKTTARKAAPKRTAKPAVQPTFTVKAQENARNVFLAGLGFYGKAFEEAQSQFEDAQNRMKERREKAEDMFNDLVKRGEKVESSAKKRIKDFELPEIKLGDREEIRKELQARLDKARDSFETLRDAVTPKAA
jgi:polyhydroxyalkanoate synthesis regulator phasin